MQPASYAFRPQNFADMLPEFHSNLKSLLLCSHGMCPLLCVSLVEEIWMDGSFNWKKKTSRYGRKWVLLYILNCDTNCPSRSSFETAHLMVKWYRENQFWISISEFFSNFIDPSPRFWLNKGVVIYILNTKTFSLSKICHFEASILCSCRPLSLHRLHRM